MYHKFTDQLGSPVFVRKGAVVAVFVSDKLKNTDGGFCSVLSLTTNKDVVVAESITVVLNAINKWIDVKH